MKILLVVPEDKIVGGTETHVLSLIKGLKERGHQVYLISNGPFLIDNAVRLQCKKYSLPVNSFVQLPYAIFSIAKILRSNNFDIIHSHGVLATIASHFARKLAVGKLTSCTVPLIFTKHGIRESYFSILGLRLAARFADKLITVSKADKFSLLCKGIAESKLQVVYNGVALDSIDQIDHHNVQNIKHKFRLDQANIIIGSIGNLKPPKGHRYLLLAAQKLKTSISDFKLLLIGDGELRFALERMAKALKIEDNVVFMGRRSDIADLLQCIDIFVLASLREGLPMALIEAMAARKAVICTSVGGIPEIIRNRFNGILVPVKDVDSLAQAMITLSHDRSQITRLGSNARDWARKYLSLAAMIGKLERIYKQQRSELHPTFGTRF